MVAVSLVARRNVAADPFNVTIRVRVPTGAVASM